MVALTLTDTAISVTRVKVEPEIVEQSYNGHKSFIDRYGKGGVKRD